MNTESELWKRETKNRSFQMIEQPATIMTVTNQSYGFTPCSSKGTLGWGEGVTGSSQMANRLDFSGFDAHGNINRLNLS